MKNNSPKICNPLKVALVLPAIRMGGVETFLLRLADFLIKQSWSVDFLETEEKGEWSNWFSDQGFVVRTKELRPWRSRIAHSIEVAAVLGRYDVVVYNDAPVARAAAGLFPEKPCLIGIIHTDLDSQYQAAVGSHNDLDALIGVSPAIVKKLTRLFGLPKAQVYCVPYGVEVPDKCPRRMVSQDSPFRVVFVGRLSDWHKGILDLPKILFKTIQGGVHVTLKIVGDGPDRNRLIKEFQGQCPLCDLQFLGALHNREVKGVLENSDALILPSNFEGFPIAPLEAMAMGVVPIVTLLPGSTDLMIEHEISGFLINHGDIAAFADAISLLARDRQRLIAMSEAAWLRVKRQFSSEIMGLIYMDLILELYKRKREMPRSGSIDRFLLGDLSYLPVSAVRPVRKLLKIIGIWDRFRSRA
jgi:glycosyltransferase involved in cell wall biosynthesis